MTRNKRIQMGMWCLIYSVIGDLSLWQPKLFEHLEIVELAAFCFICVLGWTQLVTSNNSFLLCAMDFCDATPCSFTSKSDISLQNFIKMVEQSIDLHVEQLKKEGKRKKVEKAKEGEEGAPPKKKKFFRDKPVKEEDAAAKKEKKALKAAERKDLKEKSEKQDKLARRAEKKQSKESAEKAKKKEKTKSKFSISLSGTHTKPDHSAYSW